MASRTLLRTRTGALFADVGTSARRQRSAVATAPLPVVRTAHVHMLLNLPPSPHLPRSFYFPYRQSLSTSKLYYRWAAASPMDE